MKKKMVIVTSYFEGETYGMLGPQMAATIIQDNTDYECIVIAVTRQDDKILINRAIADYFGKEKPVIGFSTLSGREDIFHFAKELREEGSITILAGPQADLDYMGETGWESHPHRFTGLSQSFSFALHGPAEQAIGLLTGLETNEWNRTSGLLFIGRDGSIKSNAEKTWDENYLGSVRWNNLYRIGPEGLLPIQINIGQVLQQIGCPHAAGRKWVDIDYPVSIKGGENKKIRIPLKGCSFCDVATDKGFYGELSLDTVLNQIRALPDDEDRRKIPFELINENPLFNLPDLLIESNRRGLKLSQINLILRADWFVKGEDRLREALTRAREMGIRIFVSSIGFEAFDDDLLRNFHKGLTVETNLKAVRLMRRLKEEFPAQWAYSTGEGAVHGFIHPTPWDSRKTYANTQKNILLYGLSTDILPPHSTPLIIHHASALGDWIREVEKREGIRYRRYASIIGWWHEKLQTGLKGLKAHG